MSAYSQKRTFDHHATSVIDIIADRLAAHFRSGSNATLRTAVKHLLLFFL
jgi:hypothetical protein